MLSDDIISFLIGTDFFGVLYIDLDRQTYRQTDRLLLQTFMSESLQLWRRVLCHDQSRLSVWQSGFGRCRESNTDCTVPSLLEVALQCRVVLGSLKGVKGDLSTNLINAVFCSFVILHCSHARVTIRQGFLPTTAGLNDYPGF